MATKVALTTNADRTSSSPVPKPFPSRRKVRVRIGEELRSYEPTVFMHVEHQQ